MRVLSNGRIVLGDDGSEGIVAAVIGLNVPNLTPAGFHSEEVRSPRKNMSLEIHGEDEVGVATTGSAIAGNDESTSDAETLVCVGLPGEDAVVASITRRLVEEVVDALFNGWVADSLSGVSGVVVDTLWADKNCSGTVFSDTTGDVT